MIETLKADWSSCEEMISDNRRAWERVRQGADDPLDWAALGYTIHGFYNALEGYFSRISKFFENNLSRDSWHKDLLDRMTLEIPGVRPALLKTPELVDAIGEVRGFRHVFRRHYGRRLKPEKVSTVQGYLDKVVQHFPEEHRRFIEELRAIAEGLEEQ